MWNIQAFFLMISPPSCRRAERPEWPTRDEWCGSTPSSPPSGSVARSLLCNYQQTGCSGFPSLTSLHLSVGVDKSTVFTITNAKKQKQDFNKHEVKSFQSSRTNLQWRHKRYIVQGFQTARFSNPAPGRLSWLPVMGKVFGLYQKKQILLILIKHLTGNAMKRSERERGR